MSKNAEGWIRNRAGRKCPVESGVKVDYRMRSKREAYGERAELLNWGLDNEFPGIDIMAYRLHKPAEQVDSSPRKCEGRGCSMPDSGEHSQECFLDAALEQGWAGPCEWRDRITEIDATTRALATERADLVQKLASEGFALIGRINDLLTDAAQKHEDMSDWRNWKKGDLIECTGKSVGYSPGSIYTVKSINHDRGVVHTVTDDSGSITNGWGVNMFKWHSRPST